VRILPPEQLVQEGFRIIKLHGSLSWYRRKDGLLVEYPDGKPTRETESQQIQESLMIYPIEEKALHEEPYIILMNAFRRHLRTSKKWLFIGYRFNDPFLLRMIEYCSDSTKKIGLIHPDADNLMRTRLSEVSGLKRGFGDKFDRILSDQSDHFRDLKNWLLS
jgi:hypothetical protein